MEMITNYTWHIYGGFYACNNGFPPGNDVIRYYRQFHHMTKADLAEVLGWSLDEVEAMELGVEPLTDVNVRGMIAECLEIPPILLALPPYAEPSSLLNEQISPEQFNEMVAMCDNDALDEMTMKTYQYALLHRISAPGENNSAKSIERNIEYWLRILTQFSEASCGLRHDQYLSLLFELCYLAAWCAQQRGDLERALIEETRAHEIGRQLANAELIIAALRRRIVTYVRKQRYEQAIQDLESAIFSAELFYGSVNNPAIGDANRAVDVSEAYIEIEDACNKRELQYRLRVLREKAIQVALEGQRANPRQVFTILERWGAGFV